MKSKQEDIEVLEGNQTKLESKLAKYKEKCEALQETIKEHQTVQAELHEKLKTENKTNAGTYILLIMHCGTKLKYYISNVVRPTVRCTNFLFIL